MPKKSIHVAQKNFLIVQIMKKSTKNPKFMKKCEGSAVKLGTQCHKQLGPEIPMGSSVKL
jgi:hypothetical protein